MAKAALSVLVEELSGKAGRVVFSQTRYGVVVRTRVTGRNPRTPAQTAARNRLTQATGAFRDMDPADAALWREYAAGLTRRDPRTGAETHPSAVAAFTGLATKFLQINPGGAIPRTPPPTAFAGDTLALTADGGAGRVTFTAPRANAPGAKTELLLQALVSRNRTPQPHRYRSQAFVAFGTALTAAVTVTPGWYVPAYRFVNAATGQESGLIILPTVQVV